MELLLWLGHFSIEPFVLILGLHVRGVSKRFLNLNWILTTIILIGSRPKLIYIIIGPIHVFGLNAWKGWLNLTRLGHPLAWWSSRLPGHGPWALAFLLTFIRIHLFIKKKWTYWYNGTYSCNRETQVFHNSRFSWWWESWLQSNNDISITKPNVTNHCSTYSMII